jgi:uncharacterized repeat protein (TIGR03803 family)
MTGKIEERQNRRCNRERALKLAVGFALVTLFVGLGARRLAAQSGSSNQNQNFVLLHNFGEPPDGADPLGGLVRDASGDLYGTTEAGGADGEGTVFRVDPTGREWVVYYFTGLNGATPLGGLVEDSRGNLYGTTNVGGEYGYGLVFEVNSSGSEKVLHAFTGGSDGRYPDAGLLRNSDGNLYGTTQDGGAFGAGTVFELDRAGNETILYSFTGGSDGAAPEAALVQDAAGNLYGTTQGGGDTSCDGPYGCGTVFKIDAIGNETVLHAFSGVPDGAFPGVSCALLMDSAGSLYGTTPNGGTGTVCGNTYGCGTVFKIDPAGTETVLYSFTGGSDGAYPFTRLVSDSAGNFYGEATSGGIDNYGTIFELTPARVLTVLHSFTGERGGASPSGGLLRDANGVLYGTAEGGGIANNGVVFKLTP